MNFQIGDLISRINVGCIGNKMKVKVVKTKYNISVLDFLITKNLIENYIVMDDTTVEVYLRRVKQRGYMFTKLELISKPSKRVYFRWYNHKRLLKYKRYTILILSTSKGLMSMQEALYNGIGGEIILGVK